MGYVSMSLASRRAAGITHVSDSRNTIDAGLATAGDQLAISQGIATQHRRRFATRVYVFTSLIAEDSHAGQNAALNARSTAAR